MLLRALGAWVLAAATAVGGEHFNPRVAVLDPFPREVGRGRKLTLKGVVKGAYRVPELIIIAPDGTTYLNRDNAIGEYDFTFTVRFEEGPGPYRLELIARKSTAIKSAARFTVYHARRKPPQEKEPPPPQGRKTPQDIHPYLVEKRFWRRLNDFRREIKLARVGWNEAVAARAREHAVRMAEAERRQHRFGNVGVREMLGESGAGPGGLSGPDRPWSRLTGVRPFKRPAPQPPGPRVRNHVVVFVVASDSLERMFEQYFVREAAFRLCALDPYCVEVAVGAARTPPRPPARPKPRKAPFARTTTRRPPGLVYYCICFVQVNDKTILADQDRAYAALRKRAATRDPSALRHLGLWGRGGKALPLLERARGDGRPEVAAAALDGLLLLDEARARAELDRRAQHKEDLLARKRYGEAAALYAPLRHVRYDGMIQRAAARVATDADRAARNELRGIRQLEEPQRSQRLRALAPRVEGLPVADEVAKLLRGP
ncbi:MAG: CAP domain-containing protein [Planctomycetota bacterium]|jgi:hypothetical protein